MPEVGDYGIWHNVCTRCQGALKEMGIAPPADRGGSEVSFAPPRRLPWLLLISAADPAYWIASPSLSSPPAFPLAAPSR